MSPPRETYAGVFLIALGTPMYEILLTRVFSVMMWHHFAFMAVSLAMFGMTAGALTVYLAPNWFTRGRALLHMGFAGALFAVCVVVGFISLLQIRFIPSVSWASFGSLSAIYSIASLPFVFSGACITLVLTHFTDRIGSLYGADLLGAALGCLLLSVVIGATDASTTMFVVGLIGALSTLTFWRRAAARRLVLAATGLCVVLAALSVWSGLSALQHKPLLEFQWVKGEREATTLYENWNSFSRVTVDEPAAGRNRLQLWGLSPRYRGSPYGRDLRLRNDAGGGTHLIGFDGDLSEVDFLKYDIASFVHRLRPDSDVLIVGSGGGRDVLAALAFDQRSVTAAEINPNVVDTVNGRFGEFTGHLDRDPRVSFVAEDARSFAARQARRYGIVQFSFVDTWAGTAAGAYSLIENSLYTVTAWEMFLGHLEADGWLSMTGWYFRDLPVEFYRFTALANTALQRLGETDPRQHILILRVSDDALPTRFALAGYRKLRDVGTVLVSRKALSPPEVERIRAHVHALGFEVVLDPSSSTDPLFDRIMSPVPSDPTELIEGLDLSSPTDDRPYISNVLKPGHVFDKALTKQGNLGANRQAIFVLAALLALVFVLCAVFIVTPLLFSRTARHLPAGRHLLFFCAIGLGFMLIEIAQMQRLALFLGHPTYGLTIVLFTLLLAGGVGSWLSQSIAPGAVSAGGQAALLVLLAVLTGIGLATVTITDYFTASATAVRVLVSVALLFPAGVFMGMAFPLGMRQASTHAHALTPWLFGINGATSVCAAVLAAAISLVLGISVTYWTGVLACLGAFAAFTYIARVSRARPSIEETDEHSMTSLDNRSRVRKTE